MTEVTATPKSQPNSKTATLLYQVAMSQPASHLFEVKLRITNWHLTTLNLKMPVWTPGSYLVREYARHVQDFEAQDSNEHVLTSKKVSKNHWQVITQECSEIIISYRIYANELTVRTNHLDATHGYFNGAALFFFVPGLENQPLKIKIVPPQSDWQVTTTLASVAGEAHTFFAPDFDTLVDTPVEIGKQQVYDF